MSLSLNPPKGTADRKPEEFRVRKYIFDTRRSVCELFAYDEYLGPLVEDAAIWEAKSGEDVGGTELTKITDRKGEISDLALRPEMTPTVTRMIAKYQREYTKPIRWFSIANFYRNERPQRGRNREFWQCNVDIFGSESITADIEVLQMSVELMKSFGANATKEKSYEIRINHRHAIGSVITHLLGLERGFNNDTIVVYQIIRLLDKWEKLDESKLKEAFSELSNGVQDITFTSDEIYTIFEGYMNCGSIEELIELAPGIKEDTWIPEIKNIIDSLIELGYSEYIKFSPSLMRGFDYYDGMVFEVFDKHPDNNRALFGGGRYNGLADIFGVKESIPAVGFAPGDETMKIFLESWNLIPDELRQERWYVPLLEEGKEAEVMKKAQELRNEGKKVEVGLKVMNEKKAYDVAGKKGIDNERVVLI